MAPLVEPAQRPRTARLVPPGHAPAAPGSGGLYRQGAPRHRHATPGGGLCYHAPGNRDHHPGVGDARGRGAPGQGVHPLLQQPAGGDGSSGAGSRGSVSRVSRMRSVRAWGPSTGPTACALAGQRRSLWEWQKGVPGGGAFHCSEGRPVSFAAPPPAARPLERAARVPRPVCPGCGRCVRGDSAPAPQRAPLRAGVARCGGGRRTFPGGSPSTIVRGAWCQALSLPRPSIPWSGQPGFRVPGVPGAVGAGVGTQHRSHSVRPCGPALLAVGLAEGRPRRGCFPPL